jgi:integrase
LVNAYIAAPTKRCQKLHDDIINSLNLLCEWFGSETDIRKLSRREMRNFRDNVLRKLPANRKKSPGLRDKTLAEHLEDTKHDKISITTVNHHLARLSGFFSWCVDGEYITTNPVANMGLESDSKVSEERETYSKEELEKIITSLQQKNLCAWAPYKLWIPLIMLYCGCRQNEACQLFVSDIVEQDGVLCFSFAENEETGARVKNISSIRTTPIHPVLLQMGFLSYVEQRIKSAPTSDTRKIQLWPECKYDKMNGYAGAFRRFFERFNRKYITTNPKRTCYSLRHNFIDNLKQSEVSENVVSEIAGHSNGKITYRRYGKALKATVKLDAMKKLDFGFDIFDVTGLSPKTEAEILAAAVVIQQSNSASA